MDLLRRHQLLHPELVTTGMNRLAQALICLTDPASKTAYDTELGLPAPQLAPPTPEVTQPAQTSAPRPTQPGYGLVAEPVFEDVFTDDTTTPTHDAPDMTQIIPVPGFELVDDSAELPAQGRGRDSSGTPTPTLSPPVLPLPAEPVAPPYELQPVEAS